MDLLNIRQIANAGPDSHYFDPFDLVKDFKFHSLLVPPDSPTCFTIFAHSFRWYLLFPTLSRGNAKCQLIRARLFGPRRKSALLVELLERFTIIGLPCDEPIRAAAMYNSRRCRRTGKLGIFCEK